MNAVTPEPWGLAQCIAAYVIALLVLAALDAVWLGWAAKSLYAREMGDLMASSPRLVPAALFYLLYPIGLVFFALPPASGDAMSAFMRCAGLGLLAYGTYNLTNMAIVRGFSTKLGIVDMVWGSLATGAAGTVAFVVLRWWSSRGGS